MAASVTQRIAFGEQAGQHVRRIGSGFGYEGEHPALTGTRYSPAFRQEWPPDYGPIGL